MHGDNVDNDNVGNDNDDNEGNDDNDYKLKIHLLPDMPINWFSLGVMVMMTMEVIILILFIRSHNFQRDRAKKTGGSVGENKE